MAADEMMRCGTTAKSEAFNKSIVYHSLMCNLLNTNASLADITELKNYQKLIYKLDLEDLYSEPMIVIGMYMAVASLYCTLAMVADLLHGSDLLHGFRRKKLWFPCKYFSVNAFTLAVIAVAMKLPVVLSGNLAGDVDQSAKLGSLALLCTMMANSLPCLATMGSTELLTNITALGVLVITLVVNVCIQIHTGVIGKIPNNKSYKALVDIQLINPFDDLEQNLDVIYTIAAAIYVALLLLMLIIYVCSSVGILGSKQIIESKYQQQHQAASESTDKKQLTVEKLQQHVSNYWVMAGSSSPQFIQACSATTAASGWPFRVVLGSSVKTNENSKQHNFVLQLEDENELAERILKGLSKSFDQLIKKSEKKQPKFLMKLITERSSKDFQGIRKLYDDNDQPDCWSLEVVTLTTIATTLPNIGKVEVESLLKSVREGLEYVTLVEENPNATGDYKSIQKAAKMLWEEVDFRQKWLGTRLKDIASQGNTTPQIVQLFLEKAKSKKNIKEGERRTNISICANSMYHIAQTIISDKESHEKLFDELSSRIADIMAACLTNLPQVIAMKAHTSVIEKREASVKAAARILGETKEIIKILQDPSRHVPSMGPNDLPFINKWRAYLSQP